jgi:hypothetical protein
MQCVMCGCSDNSPCEGGCFWVSDQLCSACLLEQLKLAAFQLDDESKHWFLGQLLILTGEIRMSIGGPPRGNVPVNLLEQEPPLPRLWRPGDPA